MNTLIIFVLLVALMLTGMPISISLGLTVLTFLFTMSQVPLDTVALKLFTGIEKFEIMAVPFFILAGNFLTHGGVAKRMINFCTSMIGHWYGGMGLAGVMACALFAAISGSSVATVVAVGSIMLPAMVKAGYPKKFGAGVITTSGALGILFPPSINLVIYAIATAGMNATGPSGEPVSSASVGQLFLAGIVPGLCLSFLLGVTTWYIAKKNNYPRLPRATWGERYRAFRESMWGILLIVVVIFVVIGLFLPSKRFYTYSIETNRPMATVNDLFNGFSRFKDWNPLLRYDGYHMLSDWLELPNLQSNASRMALWLLERFGFGLRNAVNPAESRREGWWLAVYFVASLLYRTAMLLGILLAVSLHYLAFGMLLAVAFGFMWVVLPVIKAVKYLWSSPRLETCRMRAVSVVVLLVGGILGFLCLLPLPNHFRAEGVVRAEQFSRVYAGADGQLVKLLAPSGSMVKKGTPLLELTNEEMIHEVESLEAEQQRADAQARLALDEDPVRYASMKPYFRALEVRRDRLRDDQQSLTVRAPCDGRWLAPDAGLYLGGMLPRGLELGVVQGDGDFYISAVVKQDDVSRLFTKQQVNGTEVRVRGQEGILLGVRNFNALPAEREALPSAALGLLGGGTSAVDTKNSSDGRSLARRGLVDAEQSKGTKATEPVFEIRATLDPEANSGIRLVHGQRAVARMTLPAEPLMWQWVRTIRQLFQRTYQI